MLHRFRRFPYVRIRRNFRLHSLRDRRGTFFNLPCGHLHRQPLHVVDDRRTFGTPLEVLRRCRRLLGFHLAIGVCHQFFLREWMFKPTHSNTPLVVCASSKGFSWPRARNSRERTVLTGIESNSEISSYDSCSYSRSMRTSR